MTYNKCTSRYLMVWFELLIAPICLLAVQPPLGGGVFRGNGLWAIDSNKNWQWDTSTIDQYFSLGQSGDIPVACDFDGDGIVEMGIFRNGLWAIDMNQNNLWDANTVDTYVILGQSGDIPIVADFDHDGRDDMAIFRNGLWAIDLN